MQVSHQKKFSDFKLFVLSKYSRTGASSRYRSLQYVPALCAAGASVQVSSLFDDLYLAEKYEHGRALPLTVIRAFVRRLWFVLQLPRHSLVFVEYELLPYFPALLERWLVGRGCRMVVDYDDAMFHRYDAHPRAWIRHLLGRKIATVMRLAEVVVAGNAYLGDYALSAGARHVVQLPTVIDLSRYAIEDSLLPTETFSIGWIGSPSTATYLRDIVPALARVCKDGMAKLRLVGAGKIDIPGVPTEFIDWSDETEVLDIRSFDVGIMPLPHEPWARGKCGFKLIQYMACGLPVVASPVGVNSLIVEHGVNGFLANTSEDWERALRILAADPALRERMGRAGRAKVEREYCLQVTAPRLVRILQEAACAARK